MLILLCFCVKVSLATELSAATAQVGALQLEVSSVKKSEVELKQQLANVLASEQSYKDQLNTLKIQHSGQI